MLLVLLTEGASPLAGQTSIVIEATAGQVPLDSRGLFVNSLHLEALRLGFCGVLEENFGNDGMRLCTSGTECGELTIVKVRGYLQSVAIGVEHL